jgi:hypothetical protein
LIPYFCLLTTAGREGKDERQTKGKGRVENWEKALERFGICSND